MTRITTDLTVKNVPRTQRSSKVETQENVINFLENNYIGFFEKFAVEFNYNKIKGFRVSSHDQYVQLTAIIANYILQEARSNEIKLRDNKVYFIDNPGKSATRIPIFNFEEFDLSQPMETYTNQYFREIVEHYGSIANSIIRTIEEPSYIDNQRDGQIGPHPQNHDAESERSTLRLQLAAISKRLDALESAPSLDDELALAKEDFSTLVQNENMKVKETIRIFDEQSKAFRDEHMNTLAGAVKDELTMLEDGRAEHFGKIADQLEAERANVVESARSEIEKYKREAGATLVVKKAYELWNEKAGAHRRLFFVTASLFSFLVVAAIGFPIVYWNIISSEILRLEPLFQGHVFGAVVLILIPVLGVAWVLRLLSRFTIQNMMLADDAQLRRVMAETYVRLVSEDAIKDPEDRAIILSALFRPLPGTTSEDISPPSITDVLKGK